MLQHGKWDGCQGGAGWIDADVYVSSYLFALPLSPCIHFALSPSTHFHYNLQSNFTGNPTSLVFFLAKFLKMWIFGILLNADLQWCRLQTSINHERSN